jgi:hypothetical protein
MRNIRGAAFVVGLVAAIWAYGAIHVLYGSHVGVETCWKHGWSFSDTFIDYDRVLYVEGQSDLDGPPGKVVGALSACSIYEDRGAWGRDKVIMTLLGIGIIAGVIRLLPDRSKSAPKS